MTYNLRNYLCVGTTALLALFSPRAEANSLTGSLYFDGSFRANNADLTLATELTFTDSGFAEFGTDSFQDVPFSDLKMSPTFALSGDTVPILFILGTPIYSFNSGSLSVYSRVSDAIEYRGMGYVQEGGLMTTLGTWIFTAQVNGSADGSWSAMFSAPASVPDHGSSALLLAVSLAGLALVRKKLATA